MLYTGPTFNVALEKIRIAYPNLNFSHHLIADPQIKTCTDTAAEMTNLWHIIIIVREKGQLKRF